MINHFTMQGNLTRDPELKYTGGGTAYCKFTLAWNQKYKDKENSLFMDCTAFGKTAELIAEKFHKGSQMLVEGELHTETWQNDAGENRSKIAMVVQNMHFMGNKKDSGGVANLGEEVVFDDNDLPF